MPRLAQATERGTLRPKPFHAIGLRAPRRLWRRCVERGAAILLFSLVNAALIADLAFLKSKALQPADLSRSKGMGRKAQSGVGKAGWAAKWSRQSHSI